MILLLDIGNTHTHLGLANERRVVKHADIPTALWPQAKAAEPVRRFAGRAKLDGVAACSVVPRVTPLARRAVLRLWPVEWLELTHHTVRGIGMDYPHPETIGPDRLANAVAARHHFGAPCVAVGLGTAATFSVVDSRGNFVGGLIAPGLGLVASSLHEKTALLPKIEVRRILHFIGRNTEESMLAGALHGFRGLVKELICGLQRELNHPRLPVVATGGDAHLITSDLPEITTVEPTLTLEGLRLTWLKRQTVS
ncbi:MAG: type III pantothenate kinase [Verrucomicrobia bacterium]|nr:type III pantothenate kinase [Verrucomicrobiota bacterium]